MSVRDPISGLALTEQEPDNPTDKGRRFVMIDMGRFELSNDGGGGVAYNKVIPGFRGRIIGCICLIDAICADTNADGTLKPRIDGTNVTQVTPLTFGDVNDGTNPMTPADRTFQGTRITAADKFGPGSVIDLLWATTNAFADGAVRPVLICELYEA